MSFIKKEWFRISIVGLLLIAIFFQYNNNSNQNIDIYKINTDCGDIALKFAKEKSNEFTTWELLQNIYNIKNQSCYGEFNTNGGGAVIYDLTHNKEVSFRPNYVNGVNTPEYLSNYTELAKKYEIIKTEIFGGKSN